MSAIKGLDGRYQLPSVQRALDHGRRYGIKGAIPKFNQAMAKDFADRYKEPLKAIRQWHARFFGELEYLTSDMQAALDE